jgi:amino acid transporter
VKRNRPTDRDKLSLAEVVALGIGGMVGGGIFAVLGLAIETAGHAVAVAMVLGGIIALLTGYSFAHLGLAFRGDGGSFTYVEHAFDSMVVAGVAGWLLVAGYVGTLALYASAFGAYGSALLSASESPWVADGLGAAVIVAFLAVNLIGAKTSGVVELVIVAVKVVILAVFAVAGATTIEASHVLPVFNFGLAAPVVAAGLIFVAYEGFELIPNAIEEMRNPEAELKRGLILAIVITTVIYVVVSLVAAGNLTPSQVRQEGEYALAVAARPTLGQAGFVLIGVAALVSTSSAINATLFGAARLAMVMATEHALPTILSLREGKANIPWVALVVLSALTIVFVFVADLALISSFASATFLVIFAAVNLSAYRLRARIGIRPLVPLAGAALAGGALVILLRHTWQTRPMNLVWIAGAYLAAVVFEAIIVMRRGRRPVPVRRKTAAEGTARSE